MKSTTYQTLMAFGRVILLPFVPIINSLDQTTDLVWLPSHTKKKKKMVTKTMTKTMNMNINQNMKLAKMMKKTGEEEGGGEEAARRRRGDKANLVGPPT